ncbi:hypothetical protein NQ314_001020 [Rhamnusium bicolor]|uniref:NHL repeat-containing protein 2 n=1 Tax=Rhamnusium bicolor TaxID=1586634 RepID=A0AAV8ZTL3_9CUCU|nr:hypothetical protein NQ314_001020 [Rhamnusium bicolor]
MYLFKKVFQSIGRRSYTMESTENYLYYSHEKLLNLIQQKGEEDSAVQEYLKNVKYAPVADFKQGLEWFNVSEPLSFKKHLKGKVGVHSAKFENEKISSNILAAVQRYNIGHPVVNDAYSEMWRNCDVQCWPTLLLFGPNANPIVMLTGEGHKEDLRLYIRNALKYYKSKNLISDHKLPFKSAYHLLPDLKGPLLFPGKITNFLDENNHELLAISDTGNNRVLIIKEDGTILQQIGGKKLGFKDGTLEDAEFNNPQGLVFLNKDTLFLADTENHAIRTGVQGNERLGGKLWNQQPISSPWDLCLYKTPDMDLTFHPDGNPPIRNVLIIAMAGTHQIWALFLEDTVWWKCKKYPAGSCINIAGSGERENRNNNYPHAAAFAQPSGLALDAKNREVYIADSESSSIRRLSLTDGKVTPVVGGDRNPNNLFAFGDKDGSLFDAKLQHSLGLALTKDGTLFVADTYNHKLKKVDTKQNSITTLTVPTSNNIDGTLHTFNEPAGLCVSFDNKKLYLVDTNNHFVKIIHLGTNYNISKITKMDMKKHVENETKFDKSNYHIVSKAPVNVSESGGKFIINLNIAFKNGLGLTDGAPQSWVVDLPDATWSAVPKNGNDLKNMDLVISIPLEKNAKENNIDIVFNLVTCTSETCLPKNFIIRVPLRYTKDEATSISDKLEVSVSPSDIQIV